MHYRLVAVFVLFLVGSMLPVFAQDTAGINSAQYDTLKILKGDCDLAQGKVNSLAPTKGFASQADRINFYKATAELKHADVQLYVYLSKVDPDNRSAFALKAYQAHREFQVALASMYHSMSNPDMTIQHLRHHLNVDTE